MYKMFLAALQCHLSINNGTFPTSLLKPATDTQGQVKLRLLQTSINVETLKTEGKSGKYHKVHVQNKSEAHFVDLPLIHSKNCIKQNTKGPEHFYHVSQVSN
jgi:hypothetical protein